MQNKRRKTNKAAFRSLSEKMIFLLLSGLVSALLLFAALHYISNDLLDEYLSTSDYICRSEEPYIRKLEEYIREQNVSASDSEKLGNWVHANRIQYLMVSRNRKLLYDSLYDGSLYSAQAGSDRIHWNWQYFYTLKFSDGNADVFVYDHFEERFVLLVTTLEVFLCVFLWLCAVLLCLRKDVRFILSLNAKVSAFGLGEEVVFSAPCRNDELGMLAEGLQNMSGELLERKEREQILQQSRNDLLIGLAHDLRTPLTTLIAELELAEKQRGCADVNPDHIGKAHQKALHIRDLANQLFESFQIHTATEIHLEAPAYVEYVLGESFSMLYEELSEDSFDMRVEGLKWRPVQVRVCLDYMDRIINNLISNIHQYARRDKPVRMCFNYDESYIRITLSNERIPEGMQIPEPTRRHGIGIQNVAGMMRSMGGNCETEITEETYSITLSFPFYNEQS